MGLMETIKETKEKLEEAVAKEAEESKLAIEEIEKVAAPVEEVKVEEVVKEEAKVEEEKKEEPEGKTATGYAKERQARKDRMAADLAAANKRIADLEARFPSAPVEAKSQSVVDAEPNIQSSPVEWTAWKLRQQEKQIEALTGWKAEQETVKSRETIKQTAEQEVAQFENQLRPRYDDYDDVKSYYVRMLGASIKIVNPRITNDKLVEAVNNRLLTRASELLGEGYENPIEAMYLEAKQLGYQPKQAAVEEKEEPKPNMDKVAQIRKRNAGTAGASGSGGEADVTAGVAAKMTNAEFARLKPEQKKRLFASLR